MNEDLDKLNLILKGAPFNLEESVTDKSVFIQIPGWNSLKHLSLMLELENHFNVEIAPEEIVGLQCVGSILTKISRN